MKRILTVALALILSCGVNSFAQNVKDLVITEAQTDSVSLDNGFGQKAAWIEIFNNSFGSVSFGGCFLTNDKNDLRKYVIPKLDKKTLIQPRQSVVFFTDGKSSYGTFHTNFILKAGQTVYLVSNDGRTIVDSLAVPANLQAGKSISKYANDIKASVFDEITEAEPTPGSYNQKVVYDENGHAIEETRAEKLARTDPHGFTLTLVAVGVVFLSLIVLFLCYTLVGAICTGKFKRTPKAKKSGKAEVADAETAAAIAMALKMHSASETEAAIALALHRYLTESAHDYESYVITIKRK